MGGRGCAPAARRIGLAFPPADPEQGGQQDQRQQRGRGCRPRRISPVDPAVMVIRAVMMMSHGLSAPLPSLDGQGGVLVHLV